MCLVCKPAKPLGPCHRSLRNIARKIVRDVISKRNILSADQGTVIVIECQRIILSIVIEIEACIGILITILGEISAPSICEILPAICSSSPMLCCIPSFGVSGNLIPVIGIAQEVIAHIDSFDTTIGFTIIGCCSIAFCVILKPIFKVLIVTSSIIVVIYIDGICWACIRAHTQRRHDSQALEFTVVLIIITPTSIIAIELVCPFLRDISAVFSSDRCSVTICPRHQCIHISAISYSYNRSPVCLDGLSSGIFEREVRSIQLTWTGSCSTSGLSGHGYRTISISSLCNCSKIGESIIVRVLNHVNNLILTLSRIPLRIENSILFKRYRCSCRHGAIFILIPSVKGIACTGRSCRQSNLCSVRSSLSFDIVSAVHIIGKREIFAGVVYLQFLILISGQNNILITVIKIRIRIIVDFRSYSRSLYTNFINGLNQIIAFT